MEPHDAHEEDGETPLTDEERKWVRHQMRQHQHEEWLRGQVRVLWPWVIAIVGALVAVASWVKEHVRL